MSYLLKVGVSGYIYFYQGASTMDGATFSLNGSAYASCINTPVNLGNGFYKLQLDASEVSAVGSMGVMLTAVGMNQFLVDVTVVYDFPDNAVEVSTIDNVAIDAIWQRTYAALNSLSPLQVLEICGAVLAAKSNGFPAGPGHFRDFADTKNVVTTTLDGNGNRTAVTLNP